MTHNNTLEELPLELLERIFLNVCVNTRESMTLINNELRCYILPFLIKYQYLDSPMYYTFYKPIPLFNKLNKLFWENVDSVEFADTYYVDVCKEYPNNTFYYVKLHNIDNNLLPNATILDITINGDMELGSYNISTTTKELYIFVETVATITFTDIINLNKLIITCQIKNDSLRNPKYVPVIYESVCIIKGYLPNVTNIELEHCYLDTTTMHNIKEIILIDCLWNINSFRNIVIDNFIIKTNTNKLTNIPENINNIEIDASEYCDYTYSSIILPINTHSLTINAFLRKGDNSNRLYYHNNDFLKGNIKLNDDLINLIVKCNKLDDKKTIIVPLDVPITLRRILFLFQKEAKIVTIEICLVDNPTAQDIVNESGYNHNLIIYRQIINKYEFHVTTNNILTIKN